MPSSTLAEVARSLQAAREFLLTWMMISALIFISILVLPLLVMMALLLALPWFSLWCLIRLWQDRVRAIALFFAGLALFGSWAYVTTVFGWQESAVVSGSVFMLATALAAIGGFPLIGMLRNEATPVVRSHLKRGGISLLAAAVFWIILGYTYPLATVLWEGRAVEGVFGFQVQVLRALKWWAVVGAGLAWAFASVASSSGTFFLLVALQHLIWDRFVTGRHPSQPRP